MFYLQFFYITIYITNKDYYIYYFIDGSVFCLILSLLSLLSKYSYHILYTMFKINCHRNIVKLKIFIFAYYN